jgi:hypothetical protein
MITYYSQWGEDKWLYEHDLIKENGVYVDIGAADPFINSNTAFLDALGWKGLCVEPNQYDFSKRNCTVEYAAVNTYDGFCSFEFNGELGKIKKGATTISCFRLKTLIDSHRIEEIDLMSVDIEGLEFEVLRPYLRDTTPKPKILIFEFNTCGNIDNRLKDWLLAYSSYKLIHTSESNYIFKL